tara:strand:- start:127 stop:447 length:321 start_codon:yes stop_codon:yes gene_type:complete
MINSTVQPIVSSPKHVSVEQINKEIEIVTTVMNNNVQIAIQNLESTTNLEEKTADFKAKAMIFQKSVRKIKRKMWCSNIKWSICCWIVVISGVSAIVGSSVYFANN